jgi:hypothetical protein
MSNATRKPIRLTDWFLDRDSGGVFIESQDGELSVMIVNGRLVVDYPGSKNGDPISIPLQALRALGI